MTLKVECTRCHKEIEFPVRLFRVAQHEDSDEYRLVGDTVKHKCGEGQ